MSIFYNKVDGNLVVKFVVGVVYVQARGLFMSTFERIIDNVVLNLFVPFGFTSVEDKLKESTLN